jgi:hypothetical protein
MAVSSTGKGVWQKTLAVTLALRAGTRRLAMVAGRQNLFSCLVGGALREHGGIDTVIDNRSGGFESRLCPIFEGVHILFSAARAKVRYP